MDKFTTTNVGGLPAVLDDLRFVDEANRDVLKSIFCYLGTDKIFISPYKTDDILPATIPECVAVFDNELWFVAEQALPTPAVGKSLNVRKSETFTGTPPGLKVFESGNSFDTYQKRVGEIYITDNATLPAGEIRLANYNSASGGWKVSNADLFNQKWRGFLGISTIESDISTNAANITVNANSIDTINTVLSNAWTDITIDANFALRLDDSDSANTLLVNGVNPNWPGALNSYFRFKIIGSTMFVEFYFEELILLNSLQWNEISVVNSSFQTGGAKKPFNGVASLKTDIPAALNGLLNVSNDTANNSITMTMPKPFEDGNADFNRLYDLNTTGMVLIAGALQEVRTTIKGQVIIELTQ